MSQKTVQLLIGRLLTDEELRLRFLDDPAGVLRALIDEGFELTSIEAAALIATDVTLWPEAARRIDPRLQRSSLRSE